MFLIVFTLTYLMSINFLFLYIPCPIPFFLKHAFHSLKHSSQSVTPHHSLWKASRRWYHQILKTIFPTVVLFFPLLYFYIRSQSDYSITSCLSFFIYTLVYILSPSKRFLFWTLSNTKKQRYDIRCEVIIKSARIIH